MLGASSSEEEDQFEDRDDLSEVYSVRGAPAGGAAVSATVQQADRRISTTNRSSSPAPSDSLSTAGATCSSGGGGRKQQHKATTVSAPGAQQQQQQANAVSTSRVSPARHGGSAPSAVAAPVDGRSPARHTTHGHGHGGGASPSTSERSAVSSAVAHHRDTGDTADHRLKEEQDEESRRLRLQLYVFVARCIAYHFNAKQPTDMARRQLKITKSELARIRERFEAFLRGQTQVASDEAFRNAVTSYYEVFLRSERVQQVVAAGGFSAHDFREVFRLNVERRIRSLPEIDGLSKETVVNSWMTKFDVIMRGDGDSAKEGQRMRGGPQATADLILGKDQLYDMFQQILMVKKFEHQLIFNALQLDNADEQAAAIRREVDARRELSSTLARDRKKMPKFVVKDMETLYVDELRAGIALLVANLESVPVAQNATGAGGKKARSSSSRLDTPCLS